MDVREIIAKAAVAHVPGKPHRAKWLDYGRRRLTCSCGWDMNADDWPDHMAGAVLAALAAGPRGRPYQQQRVYVTLDLDVEDRPDACGLNYEINEWVDTWSADPEEK